MAVSDTVPNQRVIGRIMNIALNHSSILNHLTNILVTFFNGQLVYPVQNLLERGWLNPGYVFLDGDRVDSIAISDFTLLGDL